MRSLSMQSLTNGIKRRHPGVVIYGIGDPAHRKRRSSHNEDDTTGSLPEQEDADRNPEHRAIDVMLGSAFTKADAYELIDDVLADPAALKRLLYILFNGWRWSRNTGWERVEFDGDPHDDHIHFTGDADDDENAAGWPAVEGDDMTPAELLGTRLGKSTTTVAQALQETDRNVRELAVKVAALSIPAPAPVDPAQLKAALLDPDFLAAVAKAVIDEDHRRSAQ